MTKYIYSDEQILAAAKGVQSVMEIMRRLGMVVSGGSHSHLSRRLARLGFDTRQLLGQRHNTGKSTSNYKPPQERLVVYVPSITRARQHGHVLRRALKSLGVEERCAACGVKDNYNGKPIRLHVDHINGLPHDCRAENLRFLCPNCHSQTTTFCTKNRRQLRLLG